MEDTTDSCKADMYKIKMYKMIKQITKYHIIIKNCTYGFNNSM